MRFIPKYLSIAVIGLILTTNPCLAQEARPRSFYGVEALSGWGQASLKTKQDYHFIPFIVDFDFDLKKLNQGLKYNYPGLLQFQIEPVFSLVLQPNHNMELGNTFALKAGILPEDFTFQPYIKCGVGGIHLTQHIPEQSTQLNFTEHVGAGASYFFDEKTALNCEVRFRHVSNGGIKSPNKGIGSYVTLMGMTRKF